MKPPSIRRASAADLDALTRLNAEVQALHFANRPDQFKPVVLELMTWAFNTNARTAFAALGFEPKVLRFELAADDEEAR